jgi:hypothetical protein
MSKPSELDVTNLLLAAVLECGGAEIERVTPHRRYSKITLDLEHFSRDRLADKVGRLLRVIERAEDDHELAHLFSASMLGEVEDKYIRLKRRVVQERERDG